MIIIKTFEELKALPLNTKFYILKDGRHCGTYITSGLSPVGNDRILMCTNNNAWNTVKTFTNSNFEYSNGKLIVTGKYSSEEFGNLMIKQLEEQIQVVKEIYLKET